MGLSNAEFARYVAKLTRISAAASTNMAEGMWNSNFCSADCSAYALSICEDARWVLDQIERLATARKTASS